MEEEGLLSWQERRLVESFAASLDAYFSQRFYRILEETKVRLPGNVLDRAHYTPPLKPWVGKVQFRK